MKAKGNTARRAALVGLGLLCCGGLVFKAYQWLATPRQSAVRVMMISSMMSIQRAIDEYREKERRLPASFDDLITARLVAPKIAALFVYVGGERGVLAYQRIPCRAVKKGERWGDWVAEEDIPAARVILLDGGKPVFVDEPEFQKEYGWLLSGPRERHPEAKPATTRQGAENDAENGRRKRDRFVIDESAGGRYCTGMPRSARQAPGGMVFHVLNRGVGRMRLFEKEGDYAAFERVVVETLAVEPMRLCAYCLMPNHWHMVLWPREDGDMAAFMQRLSITHVRRWQEHRHLVGTGHIYQGRYKSFPVQDDAHFLTVCRYVERNARRAKLTRRAEDWRWSSLWRRRHGDADARSVLSEWPVNRPRDWLRRVNQAETPAELEALHLSVSRGRPFGEPAWAGRAMRRLGLENTVRPRGRPRKETVRERA